MMQNEAEPEENDREFLSEGAAQYYHSLSDDERNEDAAIGRFGAQQAEIVWSRVEHSEP